MTDISVTASAVVAANPNTDEATGISGAAITAGQVVYADPTDSYKIKPAQATNSTHAPNVVGIALDNAPGANQPIVYATGGDIIFNNVLTPGQLYVLSAANPGGIAPYGDLVTTNYVTFLGVATGVTTLRVGLIPTSTQK
jgi:hypothetical protein